QRDVANTETKSQIEALGRRCSIYACDFSRPADVAALLPAVLRDGHAPTILVNCAGIQRRHPAAAFPDGDWAAVLQVNLTAAIAPGYVETELTRALVEDPVRGPSILDRTPAGRWGRPEDFKGAVVYLASAASDFVSGEILTVDGGWMGR